METRQWTSIAEVLRRNRILLHFLPFCSVHRFSVRSLNHWPLISRRQRYRLYVAKAESLSSPAAVPLDFDYAFFSRGRANRRIGPRAERPIFSNLMNRTRRPGFPIKRKNHSLDPRGTALFVSRNFPMLLDANRRRVNSSRERKPEMLLENKQHPRGDDNSLFCT